MKTIRNIPAFFSSLPKAAVTVVVLCTVFLAACERRPLEDPIDKTGVRIEVSTKAILNVTLDVYNEKIPLPNVHPEVMHVLFYEPDGDRLVTETYIHEETKGRNGELIFSGKIDILPGAYKMMVYNFGMETTEIRDYNLWSKATARSMEVNDRVLGAYRSYKMKSEEGTKADWENEIVVYEPDHLLLSVNDNEYIPYHEGTHTIEASATTVVDSYYLQIKVDGLEYVETADAYLSGMAGGNLLKDRAPVHDPQNTLYFQLVKSDDKGVPVICSVFNTFGHIPDSDNNLDIVFNITTKDGRSEQRSFNISHLFKTPEAIEKHWLLLEETIVIDPPPPVEGGGMDPSVEEWEDENHEIII